MVFQLVEQVIRSTMDCNPHTDLEREYWHCRSV